MRVLWTDQWVEELSVQLNLSKQGLMTQKSRNHRSLVSNNSYETTSHGRILLGFAI